jgi:hypothetical protein
MAAAKLIVRNHIGLAGEVARIASVTHTGGYEYPLGCCAGALGDIRRGAWQSQEEGIMEALLPGSYDDEARLIADLPAHVVAALDHLTLAEHTGVRTALDAFTRQERAGEAIPGPDPLYVLWAAPEVRLIVHRAGPEARVEVEDIARPAKLRTFAQEYGG